MLGLALLVPFVAELLLCTVPLQISIMKRINLPIILFDSFAVEANINTKNEIETLGLVFGKESGTEPEVSHRIPISFCFFDLGDHRPPLP